MGDLSRIHLKFLRYEEFQQNWIGSFVKNWSEILSTIKVNSMESYQEILCLGNNINKIFTFNKIDEIDCMFLFVLKKITIEEIIKKGFLSESLANEFFGFFYQYSEKIAFSRQNSNF